MAFRVSLCFKHLAYEYGTCDAIVWTCCSNFTISGSLHLFVAFISVPAACRQLWKILFITLYVSDQFRFLTSKFYPKKELWRWIKLYNRNINVECRTYLSIQLLMSIINKKSTHQELWCFIAHFAQTLSDIEVLRFARCLPSPNGNNVRNTLVK